MIRVMCAGDDCIRFVRPDLVQNLSAVIRQNAAAGSRELDQGQPQGMGQILKMVTETPWYEVDFLSKIPHFKNGRVYLTRDYSKRLTQGIQYSGR